MPAFQGFPLLGIAWQWHHETGLHMIHFCNLALQGAITCDEVSRYLGFAGVDHIGCVTDWAVFFPVCLLDLLRKSPDLFS
jgi:hypothetical protein